MNPSYQTKEIVESYTKHGSSWPSSIAKVAIEYLKKNMYGSSDQISDDHKFDLMVDVGCGGGQSTCIFAPFFRSVVGTDSSRGQIEAAKTGCSLKNVIFKVEPGEEMSADDNSVDLITVFGAVHYFDLGRFVNECHRVLKPRGCAALIGSSFSNIHLDEQFHTKMDKGYDKGFEIFSKEYLDLRSQFINDSELPAKYYFDRYSSIYARVSSLKKERIDHLTYDQWITMENLRKFEDNLPTILIWKKALKEGDIYPLNGALEKLKKYWGVSEVEEKDIHLKATFSVFMIMLTKKVD